VAFTSIKTTNGWPQTAVQAAYDKVFNWELKALPVCTPLVDYSPKEPTSRGSSITLQVNQFYGETDIVAALTPLDEETDVVPAKLPQTTTVTLTPAEYGYANQSTIYMANRSLTPFDPVAARAIAQHCSDVLDRLVQAKMRLGTQVYRAANRASTVTVAAADTQKATEIRKAVTKLRANQAGTRDGQFYVAVLHPNVIHDLREESGTGSWRVPNEYGVDQNRIWNGEFGAFEGVRVVSSPTLLRTTDNDGAAGVNVYRGFVLGREALAKAVVAEPSMVVSPQTDKPRRWVGLGWKADLAYGIYRDKAIVRLEAASSLG
jgi:N4-gp56 family major capsid protein